jgi:hypothetical protein
MRCDGSRRDTREARSSSHSIDATQSAAGQAGCQKPACTTPSLVSEASVSAHTRSSPAILFLFASLALHVLTFVWLRWAWTLPDTGFELMLPATIELGVIDGTRLETPAATPASNPTGTNDPAPPAPPSPPQPETKPPHADATVPKPPAPPKPPKRAGPAAAIRESVAKNGLAALSPPGAQLALRVDLDRIRDSPLAPDVSDLLGGIPDVHALLDGSDIDPVRDLSRLFLASPNLQRSRVVLAGKYRGDEALPRNAAENLARARGKALEWQTTGTIPVTNWENQDSTERVLALFGPNLFAITRADDLPRVLGIAQALAQKRKPARGEASAAEALLAMGEGQLVTFTVENAKLFARGATENIPDRLVIAANAPDGTTVRLTSQADFATEAQAERANTFWESMRQRYLRSPLLAILGISGLLERTTLKREGTHLELQSTLQLEEVRLILRFVRDSLANRRGPGAVRNSPPERDSQKGQ